MGRKPLEGRKRSARLCVTVERINTELHPMLRRIGWFKHDPQNARLHGDRNLLALRHSLDSFGQQKPVVCLPDGTVLAGNGLVMAARSMGWKVVAAVVVRGVTPAQARAFALADNRTAELSIWNTPVLATTLDDLRSEGMPLDLLGWNDAELAKLSASLPDPDGDHDGETTDAEPRAPGLTITLTDEQAEVFNRAAMKVRAGSDGDEVSNGRVVELLAADFISGA